MYIFIYIHKLIIISDINCLENKLDYLIGLDQLICDGRS